MYQEPTFQNLAYYYLMQQPQQPWNPQMWKNWPPHPTQTQPWKQGWQGQAYGRAQPTNPLHTPPSYPQYPPNMQQLLPSFTPPTLPPIPLVPQ